YHVGIRKTLTQSRTSNHRQWIQSLGNAIVYTYLGWGHMLYKTCLCFHIRPDAPIRSTHSFPQPFLQYAGRKKRFFRISSLANGLISKKSSRKTAKQVGARHSM